MEKQKLVFLLMVFLAVGSGKEWALYAEVNSTQAANTYTFNLAEGDEIQLKVASNSQYYTKNH